LRGVTKSETAAADAAITAEAAAKASMKRTTFVNSARFWRRATDRLWRREIVRAIYKHEDVARALRAKAELFGQVEDEVAARFDLTVPEDRAEALRRLEALLSR
jgi:hypothetical protein